MPNDLPKNHYRVYVSYALTTRKELEKDFDGVDSVFDEYQHQMDYDPDFARKREPNHFAALGDIDTTYGERVMLLAEVPKNLRAAAFREDEYLEKRYYLNVIWDELKKHFDSLGYRFGVEAEGVSFAKANPELQYKYDIYMLGSQVCSDGGRPSFPVLCSVGPSERCLSSRPCTEGLRRLKGVRVLLVRK